MSRLSSWLIVLVGLPCGLYLLWGMNHQVHEPSGQIQAFKNVYVVKTLDAYHYRLRLVSGTEFVAHFCDDYEPQFDTAETLDVLTVEDFGECWSVANTHPAYLIHRDSNGRIIREVR